MENFNTENFSCAGASRNSATTEYWSLHGEDAILGLVSATFYLVFIMIGLPWNIVLLVAVIKDKLYKEPSIFLLLNIVVTDMVILTCVLPFLMVTGFNGEYILGSTDWLRCQICSNLIDVITLAYNSLFIIAIMSIDRFLYIYKPLQYDRLISKVWILVPISITWIVCIAIAVTSRRLSTGYNHFQPEFLTCSRTQNSIYYGIVLILLAVMALAVIVVFNAWIVWIVWKNIRIIYANRYSTGIEGASQNASIKKNRNKKQFHLFRTFGVMLFSNLLTWIPFISMIISLIITEETLDHIAIVVILILFFSQSTIHPLIQTALIPDLRDSIKRIIAPCVLTNGSTNLISGEIPTRKSCCNSFFLFKAINEAFFPQTSRQPLPDRENKPVSIV